MRPSMASYSPKLGGKRGSSVETSSTRGSAAASPYWRPPPSAETAEAGFSPFVAFCFTINYILGTGFLTLPWAFVQGGVLLSTLTLVSMGIVSDLAKDYVLETLARAEAMLDNKLHWKHPQTTNGSPFLAKILRQAQERENDSLLRPPMPTLQYQSTSAVSLSKSSSAVSLLTPAPSQPGTPNPSQHGPRRSAETAYQVRDRKFEVNALCRVFLGKPALAIYTTFICLYCYCTLWAYACVFSSAMSKAWPLLPENKHDGGVSENNLNTMDTLNYALYTVLFGLVVIPLSCMELNEQVVVQVTMTLCRFVMLYLMLTTADNVAVHDDSQPAPLVNWPGLPYMLPICVFAHIFHHSIPGLAHPVAEKKHLGSVFRGTVVSCTIAYSFLGWRLGTVLGTGTEQSANLNWNMYHAADSSAWWNQAIAMYVVCFPALDVLSAFPLNAITLGNNLLGAVYGKNVHTAEKNRWIRIQFRLLASCPPLVLAVLVRELGKITDYAGTTGFVIGFSFPAILYARSRSMAKTKEFATGTAYTSYGSSQVASWFTFVFGISMVLYVVFFLATGDGSDDS